MDASDTIIYVSQKAQTVPGHGKEPGLTWLVVNPKWHRLTGTGIHDPASNVSVISKWIRPVALG